MSALPRPSPTEGSMITMVKLHVRTIQEKRWQCEVCGSTYYHRKQAEVCESSPTTSWKFEIGQKISFEYGPGILLSGVIVDRTLSAPSPFVDANSAPVWEPGQTPHRNTYKIKLDKLYLPPGRRGMRTLHLSESALKSMVGQNPP